MSNQEQNAATLEKIYAAFAIGDWESWKDHIDENSVLIEAETLPYGIPHFGLRFPSFESIVPVLDALENCSDPALNCRFRVSAIRPGDPAALSQDIIQAFVYTDIIASGLFALGQVIELQAQRSAV